MCAMIWASDLDGMLAAAGFQVGRGAIQVLTRDGGAVVLASRRVDFFGSRLHVIQDSTAAFAGQDAFLGANVVVDLWAQANVAAGAEAVADFGHGHPAAPPGDALVSFAHGHAQTVCQCRAASQQLAPLALRRLSGGFQAALLRPHARLLSLEARRR